MVRKVVRLHFEAMSPVKLDESYHGGSTLPAFSMHVLIEMKRHAACAVEQVDISSLCLVKILTGDMVGKLSKVAYGPRGNQPLTLDQLNTGTRFSLKLGVGIG